MEIRKKAVIYIRVSDPSQIDNNSLASQEEICSKFASYQGYDVVKVFSEPGISAKEIQNRPSLRELMAYVPKKSNNISTVIVYKYDRFSRNLEESLVAISYLARYQVNVVSATEVTDESPIGRAMRSMMILIGQLDNEMKGQRVHDNMVTMFKNGLWGWKPPIGYRRPPGQIEDIKGKPAIPDKRAGNMIPLLFLKATEMRYPKKYLADYLNLLGFKSYYGKDADGKLVTHILKNPFYYGNMYSRKWKEYSWGKHKPLIDRETWERANMNTFGTKRKNNAQDSLIFPLRGLLQCEGCDHPQTSSNPKGRSKNYLYYECHNKACRSKERIGIEEAHKQYLDILASLKPSKRALKLFNAMVFEEWDSSIETSRKEADLIEEQVHKLENKLTSIAESNSKGILSDDEAKERAEEVRQEITVLKIERADYKIEQYNTEAVKNFTESFLINLDRFWIQLELPEKQVLQNHIFPKGLVCKDKKIRITTLASSFELIKALNNPNFNLAPLS